jgi:RNA polymerase sigma-70 factor (ECF subfamily)
VENQRGRTADKAEEFEALRPLLFSIAYRMLGSAGDAEDIVQEAWLRWQGEEGSVRSPKAWLSAVTTRLSIDQLRSARVTRQTYVGPWLPEPLVAVEAEGEAMVELADSLSLAFLVLLESLSPTERAVFILHDVLAYGYDEVATIVGKSEATCRQLAHRARSHVQARRPRFDASAQEGRKIAYEFIEACVTGEADRLLDLLAPDVTLWSDGGALASAAKRPVEGAGLVTRFLMGVARKGAAGASVRMVVVNGEPGFLLYADGRPTDVGALEIEGGKIKGIRLVRNPEKLGRLQGGIGSP